MQIYDIPGPKAKALIERDQAVISPSYARAYPFAMERGEGTIVWDVDGNRFLDFAAGIAVTATGHSHRKWSRQFKSKQKNSSTYLRIFITNLGWSSVSDWTILPHSKKTQFPS